MHRMIVLIGLAGLAAACASNEKNDPPADGGAAATVTGIPDGGGACEVPVAECASLCKELCEKLASCGQAATDCATGCAEAYRCPGETPEQDTSICKSRREVVVSQDCSALCGQSWASTTFHPCARDGG